MLHDLCRGILDLLFLVSQPSQVWVMLEGSWTLAGDNAFSHAISNTVTVRINQIYMQGVENLRLLKLAF